MYQCGNNNIRVILPLIDFIYGTLVAHNSVEPITLCPGIFKRSVRNLTKSWPISGFIEFTHNVLVEVEIPQIALSQTGKKNKNK